MLAGMCRENNSTILKSPRSSKGRAVLRSPSGGAKKGALDNSDEANASRLALPPPRAQDLGGRFSGVWIIALTWVIAPYLTWRVGYRPEYIKMAAVSWYAMMFGALVCYHRFFAHRGFKTSRPWRVVLACFGLWSGQGGPVFWAAMHRHHHKTCEEESDVHSPMKFKNPIMGFLWAHGLYLFFDGLPNTNLKLVPDLTRFPEIMWLDAFGNLIVYLTVLIVGLQKGLAYTVYLWFLPLTLSFNCVQLVNSAVHMVGERTFECEASPKCNSRNIWWLSLLMLGDNWHNNHHADAHSALAGHYWWQDPNYMAIALMGKLGLVWDIAQPREKRRWSPCSGGSCSKS